MPEIFKRTEAVASGEFVVVTTDAIEGHPVREYLAIVVGEAVVEVPALRAQNDSQRRPPSATLLQRRLSEGRSRAISTMIRQARSIGATAIIATEIRYTSLTGDGPNLIVVAVSGTAVTI